MSKALFARLPFLACLLGLVGCTVHSTETPGLTGPSEYALSFGVSAAPDAIPQDGASTSSIVVKAFDASGNPKANVTFRLEIQVDGVPVDFGLLASKTVVTGTNGRATTSYTAPPAAVASDNLGFCPSAGAIVAGPCVEIVATPVGSDFVGAATQAAKIHLVAQGVILPPAGTPTASFIFSPAAPSANTAVQFDASASTSPSEAIVSYVWDFGDGSTGSGKTVSHTFRQSASFNVTLTVTNDRGRSASVTKAVAVASTNVPTAAFVFSPTPVVVGAQVYFDASDSRAGNGHSIVRYQWNFGDGDQSPASNSPLQQHDYLAVGTYKVLLTVTDDSGQVATTTQTITVTP
jgi:PKD repeat protein